jgi:lactate 2-monooxygenase
VDHRVAPRDLAASNFPQLRGHCLANSTSDQVFGARLANAPEADMRAAVLEGLESSETR